MTLDAVLPSLVCPVCGGSLGRDERRVGCGQGHSFDLARQGYLNLAVGERAGTADTSDMVAARARFLDAGPYRPLAVLIARTVTRHLAAPADTPGVVLDLAGGTGYYLAAVLDVLPQRVGVCVDVSAPALRRASRAHPRAAAIGADAWRQLPLADASVAVALNVFGPRDPAELARVLAPGGVLVTAAPTSDHLRELIGPLGLLTVDPRKPERRAAAFADFTTLGRETWTAELSLDHATTAALVSMGPTGAHAEPAELTARVTTLPDPVVVTASVEVTAYR